MLKKEDRVKTISFKSFRRTVSVEKRKRIYISILLLVVWGLPTGNSAKSQTIMLSISQPQDRMTARRGQMRSYHFRTPSPRPLLATATILPCAKVSLQRSSANCLTEDDSRIHQRLGWPSLNLLKHGIIQNGSFHHSIINHP